MRTWGADRVEALLAGAGLPAYAAAAGTGRRVVWSGCGCTTDGDGAHPVGPATLWDLASLTKVLATTPVVLRLVERGRVELGTTLGELGLAVAPRTAALTLEQLLCHTGGLPPEVPPEALGDAGAAEDWLAAVEPDPAAPHAQVAPRYSDVGFVLLGRAAEAAAGHGLAALVDEHVRRPLGLRAATWTPAAGLTAATDEPDRRNPPRGTAHDELAALLGSPAGHAGWFAPLADVVAVVQAWLLTERWLRTSTRLDALRCRTHLTGRHRGLGWVARGDAYDCAGPGWPPSTMSHTGFTGTSVVLDPPSGRWAVVLTNAVHLGRSRSPMVRLRRALHTELAAVLDRHDRGGAANAPEVPT